MNFIEIITLLSFFVVLVTSSAVVFIIGFRRSKPKHENDLLDVNCAYCSASWEVPVEDIINVFEDHYCDE